MAFRVITPQNAAEGISERHNLRYSLSYREVQELLAERGINVDHSTIWRWCSATHPSWRCASKLT
ncbi:MAG TPA: hypothetical protein VEX68_16680 [Bryobacteraceae bacterium]|nr:hypothetical protein [Bryobacteraceae bacterium]